MKAGDVALTRKLLANTSGESAAELTKLLDVAIANIVDCPKLVEMATLLIERGASVNLPDNRGYCPLHYAASSECPDLIGELMRAGARIDTPNINSGATPLLLACDMGYSRSVEALLAAGADPSIPDATGRLPIHAAAQGRASCLGALLHADSSEVNAADSYGLTPLFYAIKASTESKELNRKIKILTDAGADPYKVFTGAVLPDSTIGIRVATPPPAIGENAIDYANRLGFDDAARQMLHGGPH